MMKTVESPELRVESENANPGSHALPAFYADKAREISEFCLKQGGDCFKTWPVPTLFAYTFFHLADRTVFQVRANGGIAAVMFAWGTSQADINKRHEERESPFYWQRSHDGADAIFLAEVVAPDGSQGTASPTTTGFNNRNLARLFKLAASRWPDWQRKKVFTYRDGELVQLAPELIKRMIYGNGAHGSASPTSEEKNGR